MTKGLQRYFPQIRTKAEIENEIINDQKLSAVYYGWTQEQRELFLDMCSGARGIKVLYDSFFKAIFDVEVKKERMEELLSLLLNTKVKILYRLPLDSVRMADENALMIMDIVVQLEDGSIADVECQRIGYYFPGQRAACYSADLLMRQYRRVKASRGKQFSYQDIKKVYTIIFFEKSPEEFRKYKDIYIHHSQQKTDSGAEIELLQEYIFTTLDIFGNLMQYKTIQTPLEAWLTFLTADNPEKIIELITKYPKFRELYNDLYEICCNTERVMEMFSEELKILDDNTVAFMLDDYARKAEEAERKAEEAEHKAKEKVQEAEKQATEKIQQAEKQATEKVRQAEKQATEKVRQAEKQAEEKVQQAEEKVQQAEEKVQQAEEKVQQAEARIKHADQMEQRLENAIAQNIKRMQEKHQTKKAIAEEIQILFALDEKSANEKTNQYWEDDKY